MPPLPHAVLISQTTAMVTTDRGREGQQSGRPLILARSQVLQRCWACASWEECARLAQELVRGPSERGMLPRAIRVPRRTPPPPPPPPLLLLVLLVLPAPSSEADTDCDPDCGRLFDGKVGEEGVAARVGELSGEASKTVRQPGVLTPAPGTVGALFPPLMLVVVVLPLLLSRLSRKLWLLGVNVLEWSTSW